MKNKWNACQSILVVFFFKFFSSDKINQLENKTKENQGEISIIKQTFLDHKVYDWTTKLACPA